VGHEGENRRRTKNRRRNQVLGRKQYNTEGETTGLQKTIIWIQVPEKVPGKEDPIEGDTTR